MLHALLCAAQVEYSSFCAAIPELHRLATTTEVPGEVAADARRRIGEGRRRLSAAVRKRSICGNDLDHFLDRFQTLSVL